MQAQRHIRRFFRLVIPPTVFLGLTAYFCWNALQGDHGMRAYEARLGLKRKAIASQKAAEDDYILWQQRINSLSERALDADLLDERSRAMLNLTEKNELVIPYGKNDRLY